MTTNGETKMNASQKLEALEKNIASLTAKLDKQFSIVANELNRINEIQIALAKRLNAILKAGDSGGVNTESVKDVIVSEAAKELKARVDMLVEQGILVLNNDKAIDADTFIVGRETDFDGNEINPRTQMLVGSLQKEAQEKLIGLKAGSEIKDEVIQQILVITEVYEVKSVEMKEPEEAEVVSKDQAVGAEIIRTKTKKAKK